MIIIGGKNNDTVFNTICIYDFINCKWEIIQDNKIPRLYGQSSFNISNIYIITFGGRNDADISIKQCFVIKCEKKFSFININVVAISRI